MKASESLQNDQSTATENALRLHVDATPALIDTARPDGYFDYFNCRSLDFLGKSLEDVCGWHWTESVHPEDVAGIVQKWVRQVGNRSKPKHAFDVQTAHIG